MNFVSGQREWSKRGRREGHLSQNVHFFFCFLHSGSVHISSLAEGFSAELKYDDLLGNSKKKSTYSNAIKISNKFQ